MKSLIKETIVLPVGYSVNAEAEEQRNELALRGAEIKSITNANQNEDAGEIVRSIRSYLKSVEAMRQTLTKPLLEGQRLLKALADDHTSPLLAEVQRIERLAVAFSQAEQRRVAEEERKRQEAFQKAEAIRLEAERKAQAAAQKLADEENKRNANSAAKAEAKVVAAEQAVQIIIAAPLPEVARSKGQQTKRVLKFEVTDIYALVKARPDLCSIEAKASAVNATCTPEMPNPPPGLRLWWEDRVVYASGGRF
jgi:DNA primase